MPMYEQTTTQVVEARQHIRYDDLDKTLDAGFELADWCGGFFDILDKCVYLNISLGGRLAVEPGCWIIRDSEGDFYPCSNDHFIQKFKEITE